MDGIKYKSGEKLETIVRQCDSCAFDAYCPHSQFGYNKVGCVVSYEEFKEPPLGLTPRYIVDEARQKEIADAIREYKIAEKPIPSEWLEEYYEIAERLKKN